MNNFSLKLCERTRRGEREREAVSWNQTVRHTNGAIGKITFVCATEPLVGGCHCCATTAAAPLSLAGSGSCVADEGAASGRAGDSVSQAMGRHEVALCKTRDTVDFSLLPVGLVQ